MYYLLTESFKEQEMQLVKLIQEVNPADKIYLLGSSLVTGRTESVFMPDAPACSYAGHYYVLVLVNDTANCRIIVDTIEDRSRQFIPVTAMVLYTSQFNQWLEEGKPFAVTVKRFAVELSVTGNVIPQTVSDVPVVLPKEKAQEGINKIREFLAGAELYIIRKQTKLAAFMLHQAAEQALHALFEMHTGMYVTTHSIDKLVRYCCMVCYRLPEIFPRNNEQNERLFQLLKNAYVGGRYDNNFTITIAELDAIKERVGKLLSEVYQH